MKFSDKFSKPLIAVLWAAILVPFIYWAIKAVLEPIGPILTVLLVIGAYEFTSKYKQSFRLALGGTALYALGWPLAEFSRYLGAGASAVGVTIFLVAILTRISLDQKKTSA